MQDAEASIPFRSHYAKAKGRIRDGNPRVTKNVNHRRKRMGVVRKDPSQKKKKKKKQPFTTNRDGSEDGY